MSSLRVVISLVVLSLATSAIAQNSQKPAATQLAAQQPAAQPAALQSEHMDHSKAPAAPPTETQVAFKTLKTIAGEWEGRITIDPPQPQWEDGSKNGLHVSLRVTSRGNVLVHELQEAGTPLDATKYDHPVTMMYLDNDQMQLIHYCDAGNRPHMTGKASADGKSFDFTFAELSGSNKYGHMHHATFTPVDADHHIEEWTWMAPGDKQIHVRMDLHRVQTTNATVAAK